MLHTTTNDRAPRTPTQEVAWRHLWQWLLRPDEPTAAPQTGQQPDEQPATAEEGRAA